MKLPNSTKWCTVPHKILKGENFGKFGKLQEIHEILFSKIFLPKSLHAVS